MSGGASSPVTTQLWDEVDVTRQGLPGAERAWIPANTVPLCCVLTSLFSAPAWFSLSVQMKVCLQHSDLSMPRRSLGPRKEETLPRPF